MSEDEVSPETREKVRTLLVQASEEVRREKKDWNFRKINAKLHELLDVAV